MIIGQLSLTNFRLHQSLTTNFSPQTTLIVGPNASGKTAIIEAIYLTSKGDSFRAGRIEEMISFGEELGRVSLKTRNSKLETRKGSLDTLEVILTRGIVQGRKTQYRLFSLNEVKKRKKDFVGRFQVVLFRPEDMRLVEGSPSRRRSFLDQVLSSLFYEYRVSLKTYENTLKRRNRLLLAVREGEQSKNVLQFWNLSLIKNGQIIQDYRSKFLNSFSVTDFSIDYTVEYLPKIINETRIDEYLSREIASGHSLIGPHKDDFRVLFHPDNHNLSMDVAIYGSRGQQRLAVLWLKAGESQYIESNTEGEVVWLLDDILSELDKESRELVLSLTQDRQVVITSASDGVKQLVRAGKVIEL